MASNPFIGDKFFKDNPDKVLGEQSIRKGQYGNDIIVVEGSIDRIQRIDAIPVKVADIRPSQNLSNEKKSEIINKVFEEEVKREKEKKVRKLRAGKGDKGQKSTLQPQEVYSFAEINELYNKDITRDEMEAYYVTHPELNHKLLFEKFTNTQEELIKKGLICWTRRGLEYLYTYQSGNISNKISDLKRDREQLLEVHGIEQYNRQMGFLVAVRPKAKSLVGEDRIILLPHSNLAKEILIHEIRGSKSTLATGASIFEVFKQWLMAQPPDLFKKSTNREIVTYYLDNKSIPIDKNAPKEAQEKAEKNAINLRQRTKEEGDELFAKFLAEALLPEDQAKLSFLWNEKFNSIAEPNLSKIPVAFTISKTFKAGAPLLLNATQRQAVAFMMEKKSGLFAYGVGVGKTISAITCASQAFYNNLAKKFLFVVPTNTYDKWIGEIQGYTDKESKKFMQGALPQLPPVVGIFNLNATIVRDRLKEYSAQDEAKLQAIEDAMTYVRGFEGNPSDNEVAKLLKIYPVNIKGLEAEYIEYTQSTKASSPKKLSGFILDFLRDEYNYNIYALGEIKEFPAGTIFVTTEVGLQRLGIKHTGELESRLYNILSQGEKSGGEDRAKEAAGLELKIEQTVSSSLKTSKLFVEDFGFDWVCFDESHYYKKIFTFVKGQITDTDEDEKGNIKYKRDKSKYELKSGSYPSSRALSAFVLSHYIQSTKDNRNVIHLTATPFTNSPLEVFSMLTLTNYRALEEMGVSNMVDFFDTFMRINYDIKYTPQKKVIKDVVLTGYNNLPQLRQIIYSLMDKKDEGANLKRPKKIIYPSIERGIETTFPMTLEQEELMRDVKKYIQGDMEYDEICKAALQEEIDSLDFDGLDDETLIVTWEQATGKDFEGERENLDDSKREGLIKQIKSAKGSGVELDTADMGADESLGVRILRGLAMMRQITLSPFLYYKACMKAGKVAPSQPNYKDYILSSPKLQYVMGCIKSVIEFHKSHNQRISGQVIYMNAGVEYFTLIKEYLVKELHLKESEVGMVTGGMSKSSKEATKRQFLAGDILVLIGSSTIAVGVDLQNNSTTLYNCYYDWNPTDAAQIEGRIWRQGNRFAFVRIVYPQCYNSADPVLFEYLNQKTLRINEIWNRSSEIQELDLRDFDPKALQKKLITDPEERAQWEILEESEKIESQVIYYENRRESLVNALQSYMKVKNIRPSVIQYLTELSKKRNEITRAEAIANQKERISEITEKHSDNPEKMAAEIAKYKQSRYDYENDPENKYVPIDYSTVDDETIYADAKKYVELMDKWTFRDQDSWGELYSRRYKMDEDFRAFRGEYKYMSMAENNILKPMGLTFETADNPIGSLNDKITELRTQLDGIEAGRKERIERIKNEMAANRQNLKTVRDRIDEFANENPLYLTDQLIIPKPEAQVELPKVEARVIPMAEENLRKVEKEQAAAISKKVSKAVPDKLPVNVMVYGRHGDQKTFKAMDMSEGVQVDQVIYASLIPSDEYEKAVQVVNKIVKDNPGWEFKIVEAGNPSKILYGPITISKGMVSEPKEKTVQPVAKAAPTKETIKKQVKALEIALRFAATDKKDKIGKQIKALNIALKFAA